MEPRRVPEAAGRSLCRTDRRAIVARTGGAHPVADACGTPVSVTASRTSSPALGRRSGGRPRRAARRGDGSDRPPSHPHLLVIRIDVGRGRRRDPEGDVPVHRHAAGVRRIAGLPQGEIVAARRHLDARLTAPRRSRRDRHQAAPRRSGAAHPSPGRGPSRSRGARAVRQRGSRTWPAPPRGVSPLPREALTVPPPETRTRTPAAQRTSRSRRGSLPRPGRPASRPPRTARGCRGPASHRAVPHRRPRPSRHARRPAAPPADTRPRTSRPPSP